MKHTIIDASQFELEEKVVFKKEIFMFTTRLISGIVLVILAIFFVGKGGALLFAVTALISLVGLFELYRVLGIEKRSVAAVGYLTAVCYYGILWFEGQKYLTLMIIASLMLLMALYVFTFPSFKTEEITGAFFGVCYVPVMLSFLYQTRSMHDGAYLVWLIFLSSWGCDTSVSVLLPIKPISMAASTAGESLKSVVRVMARSSFMYLRTK